MASTQNDLNELWETINRIYYGQVNRSLIEKQIETFVKDYHFTYSGIKYTLIYWHDIKRKEVMPQYGIKIVASVYEEAKNYKYQLFLSQQVNVNKDLVNLTNHSQLVRIDRPRQVKNKTYKDLEVENFILGGDNE